MHEAHYPLMSQSITAVTDTGQESRVLQHMKRQQRVRVTHILVFSSPLKGSVLWKIPMFSNYDLCP